MKTTALFAAACFAATLHAQVLLSSLSGLSYSQDFNTLTVGLTGGTDMTWVDNSTLTGWYRDLGSSTGTSVNSLQWAGTGSDKTSSVPSLRSYGATDSSERALGMQIGTTTSAQTGAIGIVFHNDTGSDITAFDLAYTGELWRRTVNAATLAFSYKIVDAGFDTGSYNVRTETGWTDVSALDFTAPASGSNTGLDGNSVANQVGISDTVTLSTALAAGQYLLVRWFDGPINSGSGLAIDDLSMSFTASAVPEPSTYALIAGSLVLTVVCWRRRRA